MARQVDSVVRIDKGTCVTDAQNQRTKLGTEGTQRDKQRWLGQVRYTLSHGRPTDIWLTVGISWTTGPTDARRKPSRSPDEPGYLATTLPTIHAAVAWYRQRFWIEESFKDDKGRLLRDAVRVASTARLNRLLMALTIAIRWLSVIGLPETRTLPRNWNAAIVTRGTASLIHRALVFLDDSWILPQIFEAG